MSAQAGEQENYELSTTPEAVAEFFAGRDEQYEIEVESGAVFGYFEDGAGVAQAILPFEKGESEDTNIKIVETEDGSRIVLTGQFRKGSLTRGDVQNWDPEDFGVEYDLDYDKVRKWGHEYHRRHNPDGMGGNSGPVNVKVEGETAMNPEDIRAALEPGE